MEQRFDSTPPARVLVADDHPVVRQGLREILDEDPKTQVTAEASSAAEVLAEMARGAIDIVVLDLSMPGTQGIDLLRRLHLEYPEIPILVLSIYPEDQYALRCLKAGAAGYLEKSAAADALIEALTTIAVGRRYLTPALTESLVEEVDKGIGLRHELLSEREFQVLCHIASGRTPNEIAAQLGLSVKTVSTYRSRLLVKMEMETNAQLMRYGFEHGLLS